MRFRKVAWFFGTSALAAGAALLACSTDEGVVATPQLDSGRADSAVVDTDRADADQDATTTPISDGGLDANCGRALQLRDFKENFRCSFLYDDMPIDAGDGGDAARPAPNCANDETCCNPGKAADGGYLPAFCAPGAKGTENLCAASAAAAGSQWPSGHTWECNDKNACGAGEICCMLSDPAGLKLSPPKTVNIGNTNGKNKTPPPACGVKYAYNEDGARCRKPTEGNCPTGELKLCSLSDQNCGPGTECKPFRDYGGRVDRGYCAPKP
jgi:hypothetical protein